MRLTGRRVKSLFVGLCSVALALLPTVALAFHNYSLADDSSWYNPSANTYYSGVSVQRYDTTFTLSPAGSCSTSTAAGSGPAIYQTMWIWMDPNATTWLEMGTGHKTCADGSEFKWWFAWMANPNGFSGYLWTQVITGATQHRFFITNSTDGYWRWYVDQTLVEAYYWPNLGARAQAGMESYDASAAAPSHSYNGMVTQHNWSSWAGWTPTTYTPSAASCKTLVPASQWCVFDQSGAAVNVSGNYFDSNDGWASEP